MRFLPRTNQLGDGKIITTTIGDMVKMKTVDNETLGYFLARVHLFLVKIGIDPERLRFRQHLLTEMAFYAKDCWDAEIHCSYGWIEVTGIADRSCHDLTQHMKHSGESLQAFVEYPDGPKNVEVLELVVDKKAIGQKYRKDANIIFNFLEEVQKSQEELMKFQKEMESKGKYVLEKLELTKDSINFKKVTKKITGDSVTPSVIEPAFGVGRIIYCMLEHAYYVRESDEQRAVLSLKPIIAPFKCSILPLSQHDQFNTFIIEISRLLTNIGISNKIDEGGASIGKRYSRTDEISIPFGITIDFQTIKDRTVTLRERDTTKQIRIKIDELPQELHKLVNDETTWEITLSKYPIFQSQD